MSSRTVPFEPDEICDSCGSKGAWDFMGDYICAKCLSMDEPTMTAPHPEWPDPKDPVYYVDYEDGDLAWDRWQAAMSRLRDAVRALEYIADAGHPLDRIGTAQRMQDEAYNTLARIGKVPE